MKFKDLKEGQFFTFVNHDGKTNGSIFLKLKIARFKAVWIKPSATEKATIAVKKGTYCHFDGEQKVIKVKAKFKEIPALEVYE